jgi:hypothetical protein
MRRILTLPVVIALGLAGAIGLAQQLQEPGGGRVAPGDTVLGKVTSVAKDSLVVTPLSGGEPITIHISDGTRLIKERQPIKLSDIKSNDLVVARGEVKGLSMTATIVAVPNPEMVERIKQGGGFGMGRGGRGFGGGTGTDVFNRDDMGKKFILGEVKAINETKLTIARPDGQTQDIQVDENTSFKRGNESITLPDIKVGDFVRGAGEVKDNIFVPKELAVGRPQNRTMIGTSSGSQPQANPPADKPSTAAPPKN